MLMLDKFWSQSFSKRKYRRYKKLLVPLGLGPHRSGEVSEDEIAWLINKVPVHFTTFNQLLNNNNAITITLASLANGSVRQSTVIDNTTNQDFDAGVMLKVKSGASGVSSTGTVNVYAFGSVDGGTTFTEGASGSDGAITLTSPPNAKVIGIINVVANAATYTGGPFSVANAFGYLPGKWSIGVENKSGAALDSTEGNFEKIYERVRESGA